jgi:hypothetical protein
VIDYCLIDLTIMRGIQMVYRKYTDGIQPYPVEI